MISGPLLGCSTARNKGTCDNRTNMRREELERRVLDALRHHLMNPDLPSRNVRSSHCIKYHTMRS